MPDCPDALRIEQAGVEVRHLVAAGAVPGTAILLAAARNGPGEGRLRTNAGGTAVQWRAPGSAAFGLAVSVPADGEYLLRDGQDVDKFVRIQAWPAHLQAGREAEVQLRDVYSNAIAHDDLTAGEAAAGDTATYQITLRNAGSKTLVDLIAWLDAATANLAISADGIAWIAPTTADAGLALPDVAAGVSTTLHIRRTIAAGAASDPDVLNHLRFRFDVED